MSLDDSPRGRSPPSLSPRELSRSPSPRALSRSPPPREFSRSPPHRVSTSPRRSSTRSPQRELSRSPPRRELSRSPPPRALSRSRSRSGSILRPTSRSRSPPQPRARPREYSRSRSRSRSRGRGRPDAVNPGNTLYVTGLSTRVREEDLEAHFSKEGKVAACRLVVEPRTRASRGFAFVTMDTLEDADRCVKYLNQTVLEGRYITVEKSRRKRPRTPTPGHYLGLKSARDAGGYRGGDRGRYGGGRGRDDYGGYRRSPRRSPPYRGSRDYSPRRSPYGGGGGRARRERSRSRSYSPYASPARGYGRR